MSDEIRVRMLGPIEVRANGAWAVPRMAQQRLLIAILALRAGQVVSTSELVDVLWDSRPPPSARASVHVLVTRSRQTLAGLPGGRIERYGDGYRLHLDPDQVDVHRFRSIARDGRNAVDNRAAMAAFDQALALWRGTPLANAADTLHAAMIRSALAEERLTVAQDRIGTLLDCGLDQEAAAQLPALVAANPLAERLAGMLMLAWYRCGQRAEALQVFRDLRTRLADELGIEPGPELQSLHQRILAGDRDLAVPAAASEPGYPLIARGAPGSPAAVPRQLPAASAYFAGRVRELATLDRLAAQEQDQDGPAIIAVISGTAGVGKTALALHWAHQAADAYPDGQLYVDLHGFDEARRPVAPDTALRGFLSALQVPPAHLPRSLDDRAALYRSIIADKRMLVVLDNARDVKQVRPLLPGGPTCLVLVTSRTQLTGLVAAEGAQPLNLDLMSDDDARQLLASRLGSTRVLADQRAADELVRLCARLPLALSIAAARVAARPDFPVAALARELRESSSRLDALDAGDPASNARVVFSWSCQGLSEPAARMFRLLAVHPGPDISVPAAASLAGVPRQQAGQALAELARANLVAERSAGRFDFHELLREYATEQAQAGDGESECHAARCRAMEHYLHTGDRAASLLFPVHDPLGLGPPRPGVLAEHVPDRNRAQAWFAAELHVLLAATAQAAACGLDSNAWQLAAVLTDFLNQQGRWYQLAAVQRTALAAARRLGDIRGQAIAGFGLGVALARRGEPELSRSHLERCVGLFGRLDDRAWLARSHLALGCALDEPGGPAEAIGHTRQALLLYQELGHLAGQAYAIENLGWYNAASGAYRTAVACSQQALGLHRRLGYRLGEAHTWDALGYARMRLGERGAAIACFRRSLRMLQDVNDPPAQAGVLSRLGDAYSEAGERTLARDAWQQALGILDRLHHPDARQLRSRLDCLATDAGRQQRRAANGAANGAAGVSRTRPAARRRRS